jgi:hypothetical protein
MAGSMVERTDRSGASHPPSSGASAIGGLDRGRPRACGSLTLARGLGGSPGLRRGIAAGRAALPLVLLLFLSACKDSATEPTPEGTLVTAAGGTVTSPDGRATLVVPAGALAEGVRINIRPSTVQSDRMIPGAAVRLEPSGLQFQVPVQLTLAYGDLPAALAEREPYLWLHRYTGGQWVPVPGASVDHASGVVSAPLTSFSDYGALFSDLADDLQQLHDALNRLLSDPVAEHAVDLMETLARVLAETDHPLFQAMVAPVLEAMIVTACNARATAFNLAQSTPVQNYEAFASQLRPVYNWTGILAKLDADDRCPTPLTLEELHGQKLIQFVDFFVDRLGRPDLTTEFEKLVDEAELMMRLRGNARMLELPGVDDLLLDRAQVPLLLALRESGYTACRTTAAHRHLGYLHQQILRLDHVPFTEEEVLSDLQYCATRVGWSVRDSDNTLMGSGHLGGGDTPGSLATVGASPGVARGRLEISGDVRAFRCMNNAIAPDQIIISFNGEEIRRLTTPGDGIFFTPSVVIDIEETLGALGIDPGEQGLYRVEVARLTSGCGLPYVRHFDPEPLFSIDLAYPAVWTYAEDFNEGPAGTEWSNRSITVSPSGERFLGTFANTEVFLNLSSLPEHTELTIEFDFYAIGSWNGNRAHNPDIATFTAGGATLLRTTFSSSSAAGDTQAYPDAFPGGDHPRGSGASAIKSLGYPDGSESWGDMTFRLSFTIPHTASSVQFGFGGSNLQEVWGIDNVRVTVR